MTPERRSDDARFPRDLRLVRSRDYRRVQGGGRRIRQEHLLACFHEGLAEGSRVGITVSRKVGGAVVRNRVKRWLREAIRHEKWRLAQGYDVVIIAHPAAAGAGVAALRRQVGQVFDQVSPRGGQAPGHRRKKPR